jgi:pimeloyl-ACP methyl ester carboxylesterase
VFVEVNGLRVNIEQAGSGPPLLLLHGWGASSRSFAPLFPHLVHDFSVCAPDLPGFGLSAMPPTTWGIGDYTSLVEGLMQRLGWERAHLLGHSNGGRICISLAARSPAMVDRLVLADSAGIRPPRTLALKARGTLARSARRVLTQPAAGASGRRFLDALYRRLGMSDYATSGDLRSTFVRIVNEDLSPLLPAITSPTLVIWGSNDVETPIWMANQIAQAIPNARLVTLAGAGHFAYLDAPEEFRQELLSFLSSERVQ